MSVTFMIICLGVVAYLLGSIPSSVWIGKKFYNIDIREHGSGNAGTTNTFRVLGTFPGIIVFISDILKGWIAASLVIFITQISKNSNTFVNVQLLFGTLAVVGHIFPIYVGFKGGKGVATLLGIVLAIHPLAALISLGVFIVVLIISKYVSLSSMIAGIVFPFTIVFLFKESNISLIIFSIVISTLLIFTHKKNIKRLLTKTENRVTFKKSV